MFHIFLILASGKWNPLLRPHVLFQESHHLSSVAKSCVSVRRITITTIQVSTFVTLILCFLVTRTRSNDYLSVITASEDERPPRNNEPFFQEKEKTKSVITCMFGIRIQREFFYNHQSPVQNKQTNKRIKKKRQFRCRFISG